MTRYVYILISDGDDNYAAMCLISAISVRASDPKAKITVLCDDATQAGLKQRQHRLLGVADEFLAVPADTSPAHTSRLLKTTLLQRLESNFIFLDVDTIIVRPIADRLRRSDSVQIALDRVETRPHIGFPAHLAPDYQKLGWDCPTLRYYNSGVLFVRADENAKRLFDEWHRRWRVFLSLGRHHDQPALNSAVHTLSVPVAELPLCYNAMVRIDETFRRGAHVLHFLAEGHEMEPDAEYTRLVAAARSGQEVTPERILSAVRRRWPLVHPTSIRRQFQVGNVWEAFRLCLGRTGSG